MTGERAFILVMGVTVGAAALWVTNWWTFAAMVIMVLNVLYAIWRERRPAKARSTAVEVRALDAPGDSSEHVTRA